MSSSAESNASKTWLVAIVAAIVVLSAILVGVFLLGPTVQPEGATVQMTPIIGGTSAPTSTPVTLQPGLADEDTLPPEAPTVGATALVASQDGRGLRIYNDVHSDALVMDVYQDGAEVTVLEPSGEYDGYPVEQNGVYWIRIRTDDGLVGWADAAELTAVESE